MLETTENEAGTSNLPKRGPGRPPSNPQPSAQKPEEWVSLEEAESYEMMIEKPYIRRKELNEGDNKKFFYKIVNACPYSNNGKLGNGKQFLVSFMVQKYHRGKFITRKVDNKEIKNEMEVKQYGVDNSPGSMGNAVELDPDAGFQIDSRDFDKLFVRDNS